MNQVQYCYFIYFFSWLPFLKFKVKRKIERKAPSCWNELSGKQLQQIVRLLTTETDSYKIKLQLLKILLNLRWYRLLALTPEQITQLSFLTDFVFKDLLLTKNVIPEIRAGKYKKVNLYGPGDRLRNVCFEEFICCEAFYMQYLTSEGKDQAQADQALNSLIAALYRPLKANYNPNSPEYTGDKRQSFNDHLIKGRIKLIADISKDLKLSILYFYSGCRKELEKLYQEVFSGEETNKKVSNPWLLMLGAIPSDKFGTIPEVEKRNIHQVLFHLNQQILENKERIQEAERNKKNY